ncbi:MAG: hypothetical protein MUD03_08050, partial [Pirellula sp.]|nr:hypothetical protein [Pirellula sp.]
MVAVLAVGFSGPDVCVTWAEQGNEDAERQHFFESDIRPILREYCLDCHGATETPDGGLDLRLVRFMEKGGDSGPALDRSTPESSLLWERIANDEMPPGEGKVNPEKKERIRKWLQDGAPTRRPEPNEIGYGIPLTEEEKSFWAYKPLAETSVSKIEGLHRARTPIDALVRERMPIGLDLQTDAPKHSLVRRLYLDLLGTPPS